MRRALVVLAISVAPAMFAERVCLTGEAILQGEAAARCANDGVVELRVPSRQLPRNATVTLRIAAGETVREVALRRRDLEKPLQLAVRRGAYELSLATPHFRAWRKQLVVGAEPLHLTASFERLPTITGTVIDEETGQAVPGILIRSDQEGEAITDGTGRFIIEADPERWPRRLVARAGGYAETDVAVPAARADILLDPVRLSRGGSVLVDLRQPHPSAVMSIELHRLAEHGRALAGTMTTLPVTEGAPIRFNKVKAGRYMVLAKGERAWERIAEPVTVEAAEEAKVALHITPFRLRMRLTSEDLPLPRAEVRLQNRDVLWEGSFPSDEKGEASVELWQGGRVWATVISEAFIPYKEGRTLTDGLDEEWLLDLPAHEVTGVVLDAETGKPIVNAALALEVHSDDGYTIGVHTRADAKGTFRFAPVARGRHKLSAAAPGYPPVDMTYAFTGADATREITVRLERASTVTLTVLDGLGRPLAGARVLDFVGMTRRGLAFTDATGTAGVQVSQGEVRDVFVIPREGSLGFAQIRSGAETQSVTVPAGTSRVVVRMESQERVPIPGISVAVRYAGKMLPFEVLQALATMHGARTKSDADGRVVFDHLPPGLYELWPVGSPAELRAVAAAGGGEAPVRMHLQPGENVAVMTFTPAPSASSSK